MKYGANGAFIKQTFRNGTACSNQAFGRDPAPGVVKSCYLSTPDEKPINEIAWLGTHNAIASTYYGYFVQNSQRDSVTAQLDRGARLLEIDVVNDTPPGYTNGMYVCHCGMAPHSTSEIEINRLLNQRNFPFQLPGWTHGTPYRQFHTILKEIDKWLIANPAEIVILLVQRNSGTTAQFDAELDLARLSTGTYKKDAAAPWARKSELVRVNSRMVLIGDKAFEGSRYVTGGDVSAWGGMVAPPDYGTNEYLNYKTGNDDRKMLGVGFFHTDLTTELTSLAYNSYSFLNSKKAEWTAKGIKRLPSYVQVNNVHIGDPLRFVNDLNGVDYLIPSKADAIGDMSGDSWQIKFQNEGVFNAGMDVVYYLDEPVPGVSGLTIPSPRFIQTNTVSAAVPARIINIPRNISKKMPVQIAVKLYSTSNFDLFKYEISANYTGSPMLCFRAYGILTSPKGGMCE